MKSRSLVIDPVKNEVLICDQNISSGSTNLVKWKISCVCASERRRFNLHKSHTDLNKFIAGHESVGYKINDKEKSLYALLPHSNCITRNEKLKCSSCRAGEYNLCKCMKHAGLSSSEPGGLSQLSSVPSSQLFFTNELNENLAVFLEPLSCVIRSWKKLKDTIKNKIVIVGLGPIGCLHYIYSSITNPDAEYYLFEKNKRRIDTFKKIFKDKNYFINKEIENADVSIMANSTSEGFEATIKTVKKNGSVLLFSGFNDTSYKCNEFFPEFIHREEYNFFDNEIFYYGSSGYKFEDLNDSLKNLTDNQVYKKMITGSVFDIDSKTIVSQYFEDETYDEPILLKDIKGELNHHIKIQYHVNK